MRTLAKWEKEEFEKTFNFINYYIGTSYWLNANTIHNLRFDGQKANPELLRFIDNNFKDLKEVNLTFNESSPELKQSTMNRLIKYCFLNKVQPHRLRMFFKEFTIFKPNEIPIVYEFRGKYNEQ